MPATVRGPTVLITLPTLQARIRLMDFVNSVGIRIQGESITAARQMPQSVMESDRPLKAALSALTALGMDMQGELRVNWKEGIVATTSEPPVLLLRLTWSSMARAAFEVADPLNAEQFEQQFVNFWSHEKQEENEAMDSSTQWQPSTHSSFKQKDILKLEYKQMPSSIMTEIQEAIVAEVIELRVVHKPDGGKKSAAKQKAKAEPKAKAEAQPAHAAAEIAPEAVPVQAPPAAQPAQPAPLQAPASYAAAVKGCSKRPWQAAAAAAAAARP